MSDLAISICTVDRSHFGKANYFDRMWESLVKSGFREQARDCPTAIFDAGVGLGWAKHCEALTACRVYPGPTVATTPLDVQRQFPRIYAWLASTGCEYGLFLEDDVIFCKNFIAGVREWLATTVPTTGALYHLSAQYGWTNEPKNVERGWTIQPTEGYYGTQSVVLPSSTALGFLLSEQYQFTQRHTKGGDMSLKAYVEATGGTIYVHCPSLCEHIGLESAVGSEWGKDPVYFAGEDFDALARYQKGTPCASCPSVTTCSSRAVSASSTRCCARGWPPRATRCSASASGTPSP